jgi:hypothetical protein
MEWISSAHKIVTPILPALIIIIVPNYHQGMERVHRAWHLRLKELVLTSLVENKSPVRQV